MNFYFLINTIKIMIYYKQFNFNLTEIQLDTLTLFIKKHIKKCSDIILFRNNIVEYFQNIQNTNDIDFGYYSDSMPGLEYPDNDSAHYRSD